MDITTKTNITFVLALSADEARAALHDPTELQGQLRRALNEHAADNATTPAPNRLAIRRKHLSFKHRNGKSARGDSDPKDVFLCDDCGNMFSTTQGLSRHRSWKHKNQSTVPAAE